MERQPLAGVADADAHLGRAMPLPALALPLVRWVEVTAVASGAVEVVWNLDDTRAGAPGRLALYAGHAPPADRGLPAAVALGRYAYRTVPLAEAEPALRPVHELAWERKGLHLRLTGQGPWAIDALVAVADSTG